MDFFAQQDHARKQTRMMLVCFSLATLATILLVYFLPIGCWYAFKSSGSTGTINWWYPNLFGWVCGVTASVVLCGTFYKIAQLRERGGAGVACMLGGELVPPNTTDFYERRLRNVVEEMAIASGMRVPPVYVMAREQGINAFAAGFSPDNAVIAVTYGTMTCLTRDELYHLPKHFMINTGR